jgi:flagellar biogenesis protein FliO
VRAYASLIGVCLTVGAFAQDKGILGTKPSPITASSSGGGMGFMPLVQMGIALAIVLGLLKFVLPKLVGKMNKKLVTSTTSGLHIEESANFAGGTLYIVRARTKTLLLSVSTQGVNCLADITEAQIEEPKTDFEKIIDEQPGDKQPTPSFIKGETTRDDFEALVNAQAGDKLPSTAVIEEALERLERLAV